MIRRKLPLTAETYRNLATMMDSDLDEDQEEVMSLLRTNQEKEERANGGSLTSIRNGLNAMDGHFLRGPGDGRSDSIQARMADGGEVALSDGEYIIPADVVSAMGNGSSEAGANRLDQMVMDLRQSYRQHLGMLPAPRK